MEPNFSLVYAWLVYMSQIYCVNKAGSILRVQNPQLLVALCSKEQYGAAHAL
jgi:hypothetical protein